MPRLLLGPMLRHVGRRRATVWVETTGPCTVEVLGARALTFHVAGHHYALVVVDGLEPGTTTAYDVRLDGEQVWPLPDSGYPDSVIRTTDPDRPVTVSFGSCRVTAPHYPPHTDTSWADSRRLGTDALVAMAEGLRRGTPEDLPELLLLVGDQVYADHVSPQTLRFMAGRRDLSRPPGKEIADFPEYAELYREAWSVPQLRWLHSTVPTAMVFDDHDVRDDWNTSGPWRRRIQAQPWWTDRIAGGLAAYWVYQHLGNIGPDEVAADGTLERLLGVHDGWPLLRELALCADAEADGGKGYRWSYERDLGRVRLLVVDSRCGRLVDDEQHRSMVDAAEWQWVVDRASEDLGHVDHVLVATSLPVLLPVGIQDLESWNQAVCAGAWGQRAARAGERVRQAADLEHWAAFRASFDRLLSLVADIGAGRADPGGAAPATIGFLSGDVHFGYLSRVRFTNDPAVSSSVYQAVCSPFRNALPLSMQLADRFSRSRLGRRVGAVLARTAGVPPRPVDWRVDEGPWFGNSVATLRMAGRQATLRVDQAVPGADRDARLGACCTEIPLAVKH